MPSSTKTTLEHEISRLTRKIWSRHENTPASHRILVGISGIPGSGKTTLAERVAIELNNMYSERCGDNNQNFAVDIPMDGYHYSRAHLAAMPNAPEAIHRRGAAFTFNAREFLGLVQKLREPVSEESKILYAPSFDHATKDPIADNISILVTSRIIVLEGNYILLNREPWQSAAELLDERWFVTIDRDVARDRLVKRHVVSGIVPDIAAAYHRVDSTDSLNAEDILEHRLEADEEILGDS